MLYQTIDNASQFRDQFLRCGRGDQFSYEALGLIFDYLNDCGSDVELDVVGVCCEFAEESWDQITTNYSFDIDSLEDLEDHEKIEVVRSYLEDKTSVVGFNLYRFIRIRSILIKGMTMQYYKCANKKFKFQSEAIDYANWIFKISGIIISVEECLMLSNNDFISLERRLWREGNPLTDELCSTRDELLYLLKEAKKVMEKYSPVLSTLASSDDLDFFREWDNFGDVVEGIEYALGE